MKTIFNKSTIFILLFFFFTNVQAQDCLIGTDPIYEYSDEDCPCEVQQEQTRVCYTSLTGTFGFPNGLTTYALTEFNYPGGQWTGNISFNSFSELPAILNNIIPNDVDATFQYYTGTNRVCAVDVGDDDFGQMILDVTINGNTTTEIIQPLIETTMIAVSCEDLLTDIDYEDFGPNAGTPEDLAVFEMDDGEVFTTSDITSGVFVEDGVPYTGPSTNSIGNMINVMVESGILQSGASCTEINCIDLVGLFDENYSSIEDYINDNIDPDEPLPNDYGDWSEAIESEIHDVLMNLNLAQLINENLGLNIPDDACSGGMLSPNTNTSKSNGVQSKAFLLPDVEIPTDADLDYFKEDLAGLGLEGGDVSNPSPSAMEMIKNIQAGVDLYNGTQSSVIPLHSINNNDVSIPVSLTSNNNGLKVNDLGSVVGQNWNLNAGGMITRVVKGIPDDFAGIVRGQGKGRTHEPQFFVEIPSRVGVDIFAPGLNSLGCNDLDPSDYIRHGNVASINLGGSTTEDSQTNEALPVRLEISYTIMRPNLITMTLSIPVFNFWGITVYVHFSINIGIDLNDAIDIVNYEEELTGLRNLSNDDLQKLINYESLSNPDKNDFLKKVHPQRWKDDARFFSDFYAGFDNWWEAVFGDNTYETSRIDTEPDEFYYAVDGYSGKFYINPLGEIALIPHHKDLEIDVNYYDFTDDDGIAQHVFKSFVITTPTGMIYTFGAGAANGDPNYAVDINENTNYFLPNFYTYPELLNIEPRAYFDKAKIDEAVLTRRSWFGPRKAVTYGETYERNYKKMKGPKYRSAWHLVSKKSMLSTDELSLSYVNLKPKGLDYYSDKSFSHSFPNFDYFGDNFTTISNDELNPEHELPSKWKNGRAEFTYSATQTNLVRWDIQEIDNNRGEKVVFSYENDDRVEIVDDKALDKIKVYRSDQLFKGWELEYDISSNDEGTAECTPWSPDPSGPNVSIQEEFEFDLGDNYHPNASELQHYNYLFFDLNIGTCFKFPFRAHFDFLIPRKDYGHRTSMSEFGSLMEVKLELSEDNLDKETAIFNAEGKRTYLKALKEIDRVDNNYPFVDLFYYLRSTILPKRFSLKQDLYGYFNENPSGSPLPRVEYISNAGNVLTPETNVFQKHFAFSNVINSGNFFEGQTQIGDLDLSKTGALQTIRFSTGAYLKYDYELNTVPIAPGENDVYLGAGLRVRKLTESPQGSPDKVTNYYYETPSIINQPIRVNAVVANNYSFAKEGKIVSTSNIQNDLFSNKSNHVGYEKVTEVWGGIGRSEHYFSTPDNHLETIGPDVLNDLNSSRLRAVKDNPISAESDELTIDPSILPPALNLPFSSEHKSFLYGVEYQNLVFDASSKLIRKTENDFEHVTDLCNHQNLGNNNLFAFKSEMFQYNYPGNFLCNFIYRKLPNFKPFSRKDQSPDVILDLLNHLVNILVQDVIAPCKSVTRFYYVNNGCITTGNIRLQNSTTIDYFSDATVARVDNVYEYSAAPGFYYSKVPRSVETKYWNIENPGTGDNPVNTTFSERFFATDDPADFGVVDEFSYFEDGVIDYLKDDVKYILPILSKQYLSTGAESLTLIDESFSALGRLGNDRIVSKSIWGLRDGVLSLNGKISEHDPTNGKPEKYHLARHDIEYDDPIDVGNYYPPIEMKWNNQIQLTERKYQGFVSTYSYDGQTFELLNVTDPDGIFDDFVYDDRGRLDMHTAQSGLQTTKYGYAIFDESGSNAIASTTNYDGAPAQLSTQHLDGLGRALSLIRNNDGATISAMTYDNFFRTKTSYAMGGGLRSIEYEASPLSKITTVTDAENNVVTTTVTGATGNLFGATHVIDPNGHTTSTYIDGMGRTLSYTTEEGGTTNYIYDPLSRLKGISNPIGENYGYKYNEIGQLWSKKIPGAGAKVTWWDKSFRPIVSVDANGNYEIMEYDLYNRVTKVVRPEDGFNLAALGQIFEEDAFDTEIANGTLLIKNEYKDMHTWLEKSTVAIINENEYADQKITHNQVFDAIGRPTHVEMTYPEAEIIAEHTYTSFGPIKNSVFDFTFQTDQDPIEYDYTHISYFDNVLRPRKSTLSLSLDGQLGQEKMLNTLFYNGNDQVVTKYIGGDESLPLQKVDYRYDNIGRLTHINSPAEMECYQEEEYCALSAKFYVTYLPSPFACRYLSAIVIDNQVYQLPAPVDLLDYNTSVSNLIEEALEYFGYSGEVTEDNSYTDIGVLYNILITGVNTQNIQLLYDACDVVTNFTVEECCTNEATSGSGSNPNGNPSTDLYYQYNEYTGIDISRIEMASDCNTGFIRNDYTYDGDHRITTMTNKIFNPGLTQDAYNTSYKYDLAGNITDLSRRGLIGINNNQPVYGLIDQLEYAYENQRLLSVTEIDIVDPIARAKGFIPEESIYSYDGNGNLTNDSGKGLIIGYNLLNLPKVVAGDDGSMKIDYTVGGEKLLKEGVSGKRHYIGGFEIVDDGTGLSVESFNHQEGRVLIDDNDEQHWQFKLSDHLGNTVVLFEDKDGDGYITPDLSNDTDPNNDEVLQRNLYYPFGMAMDGAWNDLTSPRMDYLYNGKELNEELDLNWLSFGFREYDPAIGRFPSVDPIADQFAFVSPFNYAENSPIANIDLWGLQALPHENPLVFQQLVNGAVWFKKHIWDYKPYHLDLEARQEDYNNENNFVPGLGNVDANYGNERDAEIIKETGGLIKSTLETFLLSDRIGPKSLLPRRFSPNFSDSKITLYRGSDRYAENIVFNETGYVLSDAALDIAYQTGNLGLGLQNSARTHAQLLYKFGGRDALFKAHSGKTSFNNEIGLSRTTISWTYKLAKAKEYARGGSVFKTRIHPYSNYYKQGLGSEAEVTLLHGVKATKTNN